MTAPLLMPFGIIFFAFSYLMYKFQLLYTYVNTYQSGGDMWYKVFSQALTALFFSTITLLGFFSLQFQETLFAGPFFFLLPLPLFILYFYSYCDNKFKVKTLSLSLDYAKEIDHRNIERKAGGKPIPHDTFSQRTYRQPSLWEPKLYPEPYRRLIRHRAESMSYDETGWARRGRRGSLSIDVLAIVDDEIEEEEELEEYFQDVVKRLAEESPNPLPQVITHILN
jgi:hypothetical protein